MLHAQQGHSMAIASLLCVCTHVQHILTQGAVFHGAGVWADGQ
jgi:hypothetical protein